MFVVVSGMAALRGKPDFTVFAGVSAFREYC
jgi:hypothetical protein